MPCRASVIDASKCIIIIWVKKNVCQSLIRLIESVAGLPYMGVGSNKLGDPPPKKNYSVLLTNILKIRGRGVVKPKKNRAPALYSPVAMYGRPPQRDKTSIFYQSKQKKGLTRPLCLFIWDALKIAIKTPKLAQRKLRSCQDQKLSEMQLGMSPSRRVSTQRTAWRPRKKINPNLVQFWEWVKVHNWYWAVPQNDTFYTILDRLL